MVCDLNNCCYNSAAGGSRCGTMATKHSIYFTILIPVTCYRIVLFTARDYVRHNNTIQSGSRSRSQLTTVYFVIYCGCNKLYGTHWTRLKLNNFQIVRNVFCDLRTLNYIKVGCYRRTKTPTLYFSEEFYSRSVFFEVSSFFPPHVASYIGCDVIKIDN